MANFSIHEIQPLSEAELESLITITVTSFAIGLICFIICISCAVYISVKTKVPGRYLMLTSYILLASFIGFEQYMGGNLEWVLGPIANLIKVIVYSVILLVFSAGYLRLTIYSAKVAQNN